MRSLLVGVALALVACGPMHKHTDDPNATASSSDKQPEMVCHDESDTGSMMSHRVCQPRNHTTNEDDRHDTEQMLGKPRSSPTKGN
jgi:hypothetical protein